MSLLPIFLFKKKIFAGSRKMLEKVRSALKWIDPFTYVDLYLMPKLNPEKSELKANIIYILTAFFSAWLIYTLLGLLLGTPNPLVIVVSGSMEPVYYRGDVILITGVNSATLKAQTINLKEDIKGKPLTEYANPICELTKTKQRFSCSKILGLQTRINKLSEVDTVALVFNENNKEIPIKKDGDIVVYFSNVTGQPIIHRAITKIVSNNQTYVLTKGDSVNNPFLDQYFLPEIGLNGFSRTAIPVSELKGKAVFKIPLIGYVKLLLFDDIPAFISKTVFGSE